MSAREKYQNLEPYTGKLPRTYRFEPETVRRLDAHCKRLKVHPSDFVEQAVLLAMRRIEQGALSPELVPVKHQLKLSDE